MSPTTPLRGALIGCGQVARHHLQAWRSVPEARIEAICELDPQRLESASALAPGARTYRDPDAMFEDQTFDFVEICTQADSHRELVELAARHSAHVLCQKPAALVRPDLRAMIECCNEAGVRFMTPENWRFRPWYRTLRQEIDAGIVGRPIRLRIAQRDTRALRPDGFAEQPYLTTAHRLILMDMGSHVIDVARFLIGEVQTVHATIARYGKGHTGEDLAMLTLEFAGGALGLIDLSWCASPDLARPEWALNETVVEGNAGSLKLQADGQLQFVSLQGRVERRPVALPPDDEVYVDAFRATQAHFIEGLLHQRPHETSGGDTLRTMEVVWAAYRSAEEGARITL
jgi:predicted dehydrogenase